MTVTDTPVSSGSGGDAAVPAGPRRVHLPELDAVRVVASIVVVLWHWTFSSWASTEQPVPGVRFLGFSQVIRHGFTMPQIFFFISGFVIIQAAQTATPWSYLRGRVIRVIPVFWLMCTITWLVVRNDDVFGPMGTDTWLLNMSFLTGVAGGPFVDAVYWTLTVEIVFYATIWLLMAAGRLHQIKGFLLAWIAGGLVVEAVAMGHGGALGHLGFLMRWNCCFAVGICCWLLQQDRGDRFARRLLPVLAVLSLRAVWLVADQFQAHLSPGNDLPPWGGMALLLAGLVGMVRLSLHGPTGWISPKAARRWAVLGGLTYPVYLLHENVGLVLMARFDWIDQYLLVGILFAGLVAVCWLATKVWEEPAIAFLKRRIPARIGRGARTPA